MILPKENGKHTNKRCPNKTSLETKISKMMDRNTTALINKLEITPLPFQFYLESEYYKRVLVRATWHFCNICYDFSEKRTKLLARPLKCNHYFCSDCIGKWLLRNNTCPTCRVETRFLEQKRPGQDNRTESIICRVESWHEKYLEYVV